MLLGGFMEYAAAADDPNTAKQLNLNIIGARKQLPEDWEPADQQDEIGVDFDIRGHGWPVSLNFVYLYATDKGTAEAIIEQNNVTTSFTSIEREAITQEVSAGLKKIWTNEYGFSLFVSGGADWIKGSVEFTNVSTFEESKMGWYAGAGGYYTMFNLINVGVWGRYSDAPLTIAGTELNAGGWHYGALAGIRF